jgi:protease I
MKRSLPILLIILTIASSAVTIRGSHIFGKILFIVPPNGYDEREFKVPANLFRTWGYEVITAGSRLSPVKNDIGYSTNRPMMDFNSVDINDFCSIVLVGGGGSMTYTTNKQLLHMLQHANSMKIILAAQSQSVLCLANAGILKNTRCSASPSIRTELQKKAAYFNWKPLNRTGNIITSSDGTVSSNMAWNVVLALKEKKSAKRPIP